MEILNFIYIYLQHIAWGKNAPNGTINETPNVLSYNECFMRELTTCRWHPYISTIAAVVYGILFTFENKR